MAQAHAIQQNQTTPERKHSLQMRAVLHVLKADSFLYERVSPFINFDTMDSRFQVAVLEALAMRWGLASKT